MNEPMFSLLDIISILGYPLVGWLSYRAGWLAGVEHTVTELHERGLIDLEEEEEES